MIQVKETCWLAMDELLRLLTEGQVTVQSNDGTTVEMHVMPIDATAAKELAANG
jgi:hypothetical protein